MKLVDVSYEQSRLNFFRDQLAAANRRLDAGGYAKEPLTHDSENQFLPHLWA